MELLELMKYRRSVRKYQERQIPQADLETIMEEWNIPENYVACCFVLLGYCEGDYPAVKGRKASRTLIVK